MASRFGAVPHAETLSAFGVAGCGWHPQQMAAAREAVEAVLGTHGVQDAAGVVAMFASISRLVDLTGEWFLQSCSCRIDVSRQDTRAPR
jgi:hypothetical protein